MEIRILPGSLGAVSRPVNDCSITLRAPARSPAQAHARFTPGSADIEPAQARWRVVNAPHLAALVHAGAMFVKRQAGRTTRRARR